ncbi:uncharacterized protein LOC122662900 [Telopea speciosissima]|uniref:uncharacterized protein LOC122662900 n=1 Tax=Telopea speciosissima TaxID=54955 RepID=UPI001CC351DC|nr:uncharacterized protein LOC122662900 [Telopea speciosissima]
MEPPPLLLPPEHPSSDAAHSNIPPPTMPPSSDIESDDDIFEVDEVTEDRLAQSWDLTLVGSILLGKPYCKQAVTEALIATWNTKFSVSSLYKDTYMFHFQHAMDMQNILGEGPWFVAGNLIILEKWVASRSWKFEVTDFWIQFHALPEEFMDLEIAAKLAKKVGTPWKVMLINGFRGGQQLCYLRARITLKILKPLKSSIMLKRRDGTQSIIEVRYERLPLTCF